MLESLRVRPQICARIRSGPFAPCIDDLLAALHRDRYRRSVIRRYVLAADRFGAWLQRHGRRLDAVDDAVLARYVAHLKRRPCPARPGGRLPELAIGARRVAAFLWATGRARRACEIETEQDRCLRSFDEYLANARGATAGTRRIYLRYVRQFLKHQFGTGAPEWSKVTARGIAAFVREAVAPLSPSSCRGPVTAVRTWLRFLVTTGELRAGLDAAVPTIRQWKLAALPRVLSEEDTGRVLSTVAANTSCAGVRDHAVLTLLARLGLRASEVAALRIDDCDWRIGQIRVRPGKSARERTLPLPQDVGEALIAHLRARPPVDAGRFLFHRARPPYAPIRAATVTNIAHRWLCRANVSLPRAGAHVFRHTVATRMVQRGTTFKAVADVLGHARLETTAIYAKLDVDTLESVALPWPGGES
jgi:site-specific recombinase XerD